MPLNVMRMACASVRNRFIGVAWSGSTYTEAVIVGKIRPARRKVGKLAEVFEGRDRGVAFGGGRSASKRIGYFKNRELTIITRGIV